MNKEKRSIGTVDFLDVDLSNPSMKFTSVYRSLNLVTGLNGTGKTLSNVLLFVVGTALMSFIELSKEIPDFSLYKEKIKESFTKIVNYCIDIKLEGNIQITYSSGCSFRLYFKEGKVIDFTYYFSSNINDFEVTPPKYLSTNLRLFSSIEVYLTLLNTIKQTSKDDDEFIEKSLENVKLYDFILLASLLANINKEIYISQEFIELLMDSKISSTSLSTLSKDDKLYITLDDNLKFSYHCKFSNGYEAFDFCKNLSNGEQAILSMGLLSNKEI